MGAYQNAIQGTEILIAAMMGTLGNSTFNALICVTVHNGASFHNGYL